MYRCDLILCKTAFTWQPFWIYFLEESGAGLRSCCVPTYTSYQCHRFSSEMYSNWFSICRNIGSFFHTFDPLFIATRVSVIDLTRMLRSCKFKRLLWLFFLRQLAKSEILTCWLTLGQINLCQSCRFFVKLLLKNCCFVRGKSVVQMGKWNKTFLRRLLFFSSLHLYMLAFLSLGSVHTDCCCLGFRLYVNITRFRLFSGVRLLIALYNILTEQCFSTSFSVERQFSSFFSNLAF